MAWAAGNFASGFDCSGVAGMVRYGGSRKMTLILLTNGREPARTNQTTKGFAIMKTKFTLFFSLVALASWAQTNAVHNWTLKSGATFSGDYFTSGTQMVVIKSHGTNCLLNISDLSTNDWIYFQECKTAQHQRQLDAEAAQMRANGKMEFSVQLFEHFPESVVNRYGWIDATFEGLDDSFVESKEDELGFDIRENNESYYRCRVIKRNPYNDVPEPIVSEIMGLRRGDRVRFIGMGMPDIMNDSDKFSAFYVSNVEMIESAADAAAAKNIKEDLENSQRQGIIK
ncbi:MAG: hypothetical protein ABSE16_10260 [Verrucomicrobiota bacterium]